MSFDVSHPPSHDPFFTFLGSDSTDAFHAIGHSEDAVKLRETYFIGTYDEVPIILSYLILSLSMYQDTYKKRISSMFRDRH